MLCPFCNQEIRDEANFCGKCGRKIPRCPTCNRVITARVKFCSQDGTPLPKELLEGLPEAAAASPPLIMNETPDPQPEQSFIEQEERGKKNRILPILLVILLLGLVFVGVGFAFSQGIFPLGGSREPSDGEISVRTETEIDDSEDETEDTSANSLTPTADSSAVNGYTEAETTDGNDETADVAATGNIDEETEHRYEIIMADVSWTEALELANEAGGHLAAITTAQEYDQICELASAQEQAWLKDHEDSESVTLYLWLGGSITSSSMNWGDAGTWITGETWIADMDDWWYPGEPSKEDEDGTKEYYLCLWNAQEKGWTLNDQRNDIIEAIPAYAGRVGYVVEYGDGYRS